MYIHQHPFIRDVKDSQSIMELVSEANAEIILEEKDLDDVRAFSLITLIEVRSNAYAWA